jgi:O-antigen/teichoic acid export membrane protein
MDFQRLFKLDLYVLTIDLITAIIAAIVWRNAWALVLGTFAATLTRVIMSYFIYPYRPRLVLDLKEARNLFSYGQWMLYSAILFFILSKGTDLVSGVIFGASALGLYQMASRFALLPTNHLGEVFLSTLFPAYSIIQGDPRRLRTAFLSVLQLSTFLIFPLSTLMAVTIGPTLPLILGPKWQGVVNLVTGLAVGGAIQALLRTGSPLFMATGRPNYQFIMDAASSAGIILCLYPLSNLLGLAGLPWAYAAGISFGLPVWWFFIRKQGHVGNRDILIAITPAILGSFLLALSIRVPLELMQIKETNINILPKLLGLVSVGLLSYVGLVLLIEKILPGYLPIKTSFNLMQRTFQKETA